MTREEIIGHWRSGSNVSGLPRDIFFTLLAIACFFILHPLQNDQMAVLCQLQFFPVTQFSGHSRNSYLSPSIHDLKFSSAELQWMFPFLSTQCTIPHAWPGEKQPAQLPCNRKKKILKIYKGMLVRHNVTDSQSWYVLTRQKMEDNNSDFSQTAWLNN